jgi:SagB-type dehydrogenase family enzyme
LSPKDHQLHYLTEFNRIAARDQRLLWSPVHARLDSRTPEAPKTGAVPGGSEDPLDARTVAGILARTAGEIINGGQRRRLVPTGGNLGSVGFWVIVRRVAGLQPGAYLYDPHRQALDLIGQVDDERLRTALRHPGPLPDCVLIGTGALAVCARKYGSFAYRLIHFDAGVALAYLHLVTAEWQVGLRECPDVDLGITEVFGVPCRWEFPVTTFAIGLGPNPRRNLTRGRRPSCGRRRSARPTTRSTSSPERWMTRSSRLRSRPTAPGAIACRQYPSRDPYRTSTWPCSAGVPSGSSPTGPSVHRRSTMWSRPRPPHAFGACALAPPSAWSGPWWRSRAARRRWPPVCTTPMWARAS